VACICVVVRHLTHDYKRLVTLLKSCNGEILFSVSRPHVADGGRPARLRTYVDRQGNTLSPADTSVVATLMCITSLIVEHCDFDKLRDEQTGACRRSSGLRFGRSCLCQSLLWI
jgi:cohesin loading factor subunit SCC2